MVDFIKKQSVGFYLCVAAFILGIVTLIIYATNAATLYYSDLSVQIVVMTVFAILFVAGAAALSQFSFAENKYVKIAIDIILIGAALLIIFSLFSFIGSRVESLAYVFGSELETNNAAAQSGTRQAIAGFVLYLITWLAIIVALFFRITKKTKENN